MQLIKQSYELLLQEIPIRKPDDTALSYKGRYMQAMFKHIEYCGRVCYNSLDRITENSAEKFVEGLIHSYHFSPLEHGVVYLKAQTGKPSDIGMTLYNWPFKGDYKEYSKINRQIIEKEPNESQADFANKVTEEYTYITTTYRIIIQNHWEDDLQYLCEPTEYHEKRHTVLLHSCIHVYKDLTRHRKASFSIESTRYVNMTKTEKFGEMKFVVLPWLPMKEGIYNEGSRMLPIAQEYMENNPAASRLLLRLVGTEKDYAELISLGWQPQQAAEILPQCTAADVVMTAYDSDWSFIFDLRVLDKTGKAHPLVHEVLDPVYNEFKEKGWI